jgi:CRISPR-associated endoribonuclease Cas6
MRIKSELTLESDIINIDYRRIFMSLIKNAIRNYDPLMCAMLYGNENNKLKVNKPFTFSVFFPEFQKIENDHIYFNKKVNLFFSSNDERFLVALYNGLKGLHEIPLDTNNSLKIHIENIFLMPKINIKNNKVSFKTMSPILINHKENDNYVKNNDFKYEKYILPDEKGFLEDFKRIIVNQASAFNVPCIADLININIRDYKPMPLKHFNQIMSAWLGTFDIEATQQVLQLVYDTGIGVRRSQGFGMLDIIKSNNYE